MARTAADQSGADRRERVIQAATDEFAEFGYEGASLNRIIAAAGISKGSMYHHFADKEDLFLVVVARVLAPFAELPNRLDQVNDIDSFWREIDRLLQATYVLAMTDPRMAGIARSLYEFSRKPRTPRTRAMEQTWLDWLGGLLDLGRSLGAVRRDIAPELLAVATSSLVAGLDGWISESWDQAPDSSVLDDIEAALTLIRSMVAPRE